MGMVKNIRDAEETDMTELDKRYLKTMKILSLLQYVRMVCH